MAAPYREIHAIVKECNSHTEPLKGHITEVADDYEEIFMTAEKKNLRISYNEANLR